MSMNHAKRLNWTSSITALFLLLSTTAFASLETTTITLPGGVPLVMVTLPPGSYQMGANENDGLWDYDSDELPPHNVDIGYSFQMCKFEVTQAQLLAIGGTFDPPCRLAGEQPVGQSWNALREPNGVIDKLNDYITSSGQGSANFRLPSEAEWEYACRAGSQMRFCFGNSSCSGNVTIRCSSCELTDYAWYCANAPGDPCARPGGLKLPNAFGLYDMHGNNAEWCEDWYQLSYNGAPTNGKAWLSPGSYKVVRGGSLTSHPRLCRSANRKYLLPDSRAGFRFVRTPAAVLPAQNDGFTTDVTTSNPTSPGWSYYDSAGTNAGSYDSTHTALQINQTALSNTSTFNVSGWTTNLSDWLPYGFVGTENVVRAKNYIFASGQSPDLPNVIPNFRLKLQNASAAAAVLEVLAVNSAANDIEDQRGAEIQPSRDPAKPSLYRVDYNPVDIPYLASNAGPQGFGGIQRTIEAYTLGLPQSNGNISLAESNIGVYPALALADSAALNNAVFRTKIYGVADLQNFNGTEYEAYRLTSAPAGQLGSKTFSPPVPVITYDASTGVTMDSTGYPASADLAVCSLNFSPVSKAAANWADSDYQSLVRVENGKQYKIRFHIVSSRASNVQSLVQVRARSNRFLWAMKQEIGGAFPTNNAVNIAIAGQLLPGIGCQNPNPGTLPPGTGGGWYTLIFHSPLSSDIRPDVAGDISAKMPYLSSRPGPGDGPTGNATSDLRRAILVGADLIDTWSRGANANLEAGLFTVDGIEVRSYNLIPD
ncbi:MAG: formylglycine-generating enzyme family protein [Candidatus Sumerlaeaceae bacterium]|nr:formylglycine-generating enzyme family protein [Candidatus Sumerlaeaceae bacterium]